MYNVTDAFKAAISQTGRELRSRITLGANVIDDIYITSIRLTDAATPGSDFEIGTAVMAMVDIELLDVDYTLMNYAFEDQEILIEIAVKLADDTFEYAPLGLFTIDKPVLNKRRISLSGVDRMHKFEKDYVSTLVYPATLLQIAQEICASAGVELKNVSFPNSDYTLNTAPVLDGITLRKSISQVAELAGGYAHITRDGKLEIFNLSTSTSVPITLINYSGTDIYAFVDNEAISEGTFSAASISLDKDSYISMTSKEQVRAVIDTVIVKLGAEAATQGPGTNPYYVVDNLFCQDPNGVVLAIYNTLNGLTYMPFTSRWQGNPAVDCGDVISVETEAGYYSSIVLARKLEYKGGLREEYSAPGMSYTEKNSTGKGSLTQDMEKAKTEIKVLAGEISQKVSKGEMSTEIIQNAESVRIAVEQIGGRNFIKNGAFYFSLSNWTQWGTPSQLGVGPSTVSGYPQRLALTTTGDNQGVYQAVTGLRVGATYTLSALVIVGAENGIPCLMVDNNGELPGVYCENAPKDGFKRYSLAFVAKANTVTVYFGKDTGGAIGWYGVVGIKLEEGPNATEWTPHISEMKSGCFEVTDEHARFTAQDGSYTEFVPGTTGLKWHKAEGDSGKDYFYLMAQGVVVHESGTITDTITLPAEFIGKTVNVIVAVQDMHIDLDIENSVVWYLKVSEGNTFVCTDGTFHVMCMYFGDKLNYVWSAIA